MKFINIKKIESLKTEIKKIEYEIWKLGIMINSGNNILRFVKMATARQGSAILETGQMYLYKFTADSLKGEHLSFFIQVTPFGELPSIIRDLIKLTKTKEWCDVQLVETSNQMLMIKSIRQILNQEEMNERSRIARITIKN